MSPTALTPLVERSTPTKSSQTVYVDIITAWGEGFHVAGLVVLMLIVVCNFRRQVLLHKLIFIEMFLALWQGLSIFFDDPVYGWVVSSTVVPLYISYVMHNVIAWMKIRPFLKRRGTIIYLGSLAFVSPYWAVALWTNYEHFNGLGDDHYKQIRPWETFVREPWWVFTSLYLVWVLKKRYNCGLVELMKTSSRFGVLIFCMVLCIAFVIVDLVAVLISLNHSGGVNPYWRMALVFKCASDTIFLDDFKSVLNALVRHSIGKAGGQVHYGLPNGSDSYGLSSTRAPKPDRPKNERHESGYSFGRAEYQPMEPSAEADVIRSPPLAGKGWREKLYRRHNKARKGSRDSQIRLDTTVTVQHHDPSNENQGTLLTPRLKE